MDDSIARRKWQPFLAALICACTAVWAGEPAAQPAEAKPVSEKQPDQATTWPPADRLTEWEAGVPGGIPAVPVTVDLTAAGLAADGKTDVSAALQRAIDSAKTPGTVLLGPGTFLLSQPVNLKSGVVLRGSGLDKTHLIAMNNPPRHTWPPQGALQICGKAVGSVPIAEGATLGSRQLTLASAAGLKAGALVLVQSAPDPELDPDHRPGQIVRQAGVAGNAVTLDGPLRWDCKTTLRPCLVTLAPMTDAGIEDLHIRRDNEAPGSIIRLDCADCCWVRNCEVELGMNYLIHISCCRHVTVESCYIHHAHSQAGGGHGYGVEIDTSASDCLMQNNIFHTLRHAMIIQNYANGCVFAYNYSFDSLGCGGDLTNEPPWFHSGDISVHGGHAYADLYEGNIVTRASMGDRQAVGPRVVFFRNRIALTQKAHDVAHFASLGGTRPLETSIDAACPSFDLTIVGNTVADGGRISIRNTCRDVLVAGNLVQGKQQWDSVPASFAGGKAEWWTSGSGYGTPIKPMPLPASLFLKSKPAFWGDKPWPGIGADVDAKSMTALPAQEWYARIQQAGHTIPFAPAASPAPSARSPR
jgi:hypothetical protein